MILQTQNISFKYREKNILEGINLEIHEGDIVSLLGANGSGKSTLIKVLLGLLKPQVGSVLLEGKPIQTYTQKAFAQKVAYVPQNSYLPFSYTVLEVVMMGRIAHQSIFSNYTKEDEKIAKDTLEVLGIMMLEKLVYNELSGGQKQLVLIARALAQEARILIMDEPVSGLDYGNQLRLLEKIQHLASKGYTFLKSTHYPDHALWISNKVLLMKEGKIIADGDTLSVIHAQNIKKLYGVDVKISRVFKNQHICIPLFQNEVLK